MAVEVTKAEQSHIDALLGDMRMLDAAEMKILEGVDPRTGLERSVALSNPHAYAAVDVYGATVAVFGMGVQVAIGGRVGVPWLIGANRLRRHAIDLVRLTRLFVDHVLENDVDVLRNVVWSGNGPSIRYLRAVGFKFGPAFPVGGAHRAMVFEMRRADDV